MHTLLQSLVSWSGATAAGLLHCNAVLAGIPLHLAQRLQSVINMATWLVFASSKCNHITLLLRQLHWLKVPWRISCKIGCPGLQMSLWPDTVIPCWWTSPSSRVWVSKASAFRFVSWTVCFLYPPLSLRRPSISNRRCTDLAQSSTAYHICSVTSRLLLSLEDILLRTLLPVITVVMPVKWHCHLWTR